MCGVVRGGCGASDSMHKYAHKCNIDAGPVGSMSQWAHGAQACAQAKTKTNSKVWCVIHYDDNSISAMCSQDLGGKWRKRIPYKSPQASTMYPRV